MTVATRTLSVTVPDIGDFKDVPIVEVLVQPGDVVKIDDPLITLETDKASMEVPAPSAGTVRTIHVKVGDRVGQGSPVVELDTGDAAEEVPAPPSLVGQQEPDPQLDEAPPIPEPGSPDAVRTAIPVERSAATSDVHASPGVRRLAHELGVDLRAVTGSGEKGRLTKDDVKAFLRGPAASTAAGIDARGRWVWHS